jgi:Na+-transporting NADH:ubiquinone oxidoreductase subunit C
MSASDQGSGPGGGSWLRRLRDLPNESPLKTVLVVTLVCLTASVLVSASAVLLKPIQLANKERESQARLGQIIAYVSQAADPAEIDKDIRLEARLVDLATGTYVAGVEVQDFDPILSAKDPEQSTAIPPARDMAQIKRRAHYAVVHLVYQQGQLRLAILPVHGRGFGSVLYGHLGLSADTRTVIGLRFHEHGETPGLGALIDDQGWLDQWQGKQVWDAAGQPWLGVADGVVVPGSSEASHLVDGLTGATWTARGVTNLLRFWLGEDGFGPYLRNLREGRGLT